MHSLKFCGNNIDDDMEEMLEQIREKLTNVDIAIEPCLGHCAKCAVQYFALVDDELLYAETTDELFESIQDAIG